MATDDGKTLASVKPGGQSVQPKKRLRKVGEARSMARSLSRSRSNLTGNGGLWNRLQGQYDMRPPESEAWMTSNGKGHLANFNTGEFRAEIDSDIRPYYSMLTTAETPAEWETLAGSEWQRQHWMGTWSARYRELLGTWRGYSTECMLFLKQRALFGTGPIVWCDSKSWRFRARPAWSVLLPKGSSANPDDWWFVQIVDSMKPHELVAILTEAANRGSKGYRLRGWNKNNVKKAIENYTKNDEVNLDLLEEQALTSEAVNLQESIFSKSYSKHEDVVIVRNFVREFDGKWSEQIFTLNGDEGFIFENISEYRTAHDFMNPMPYDVEFQYASIKGLGDLMTTPTMARDKLFNHAVNTSMVNSSLIIQGAVEGDESKYNQIIWDYDGTYLPAGLQVVGNTLRTNNELLGIAQRFGVISDSNTSAHQTHELERTGGKTAKQYTGEQSQRAQVSQYRIDFFRRYMTEVHATIMRRIQRQIVELELPKAMDAGERKVFERMYPGALELNKVLTKLVVDDQVPIEAILGIDADTCMVDFPPTLNQLMLIADRVPGLGPEASRVFDRLFLQQAVPSAAAKILPADDAALDNSQEQMAQMEHAAFAAGLFVTPGTRNNHMTHAVVHTEHAMGRMALYEERQIGDDLASKTDHYKEMVALWTHNMGEEAPYMGHVKILEASVNQEYAVSLLQQWGQFYGMLQKLDAEIKEQGQAEQQNALEQAQAPQMSAVDQEKILTEQTRRQMLVEQESVEQQRKNIEFEADMTRKLESHNIEMRIKQSKANFEAENERKKLQAK